MTQENKELLLKDICARLPYGVFMTNKKYDYRYYKLEPKHMKELFSDEEDNFYSEDIPYLFPISSMTEEQKKEYNKTLVRDGIVWSWTSETFDWLNKNHFDYRGLIPMGLAIDATGLNIY